MVVTFLVHIQVPACDGHHAPCGENLVKACSRCLCRTATIHVKTCVELHSFSVKLSASPRSCVKKALSISARKYGAKFSFVEVFDTVSKMPVHNWEKLSHVPEGGLTITTTPSNTRTGTLASLIEDSQKIQKLLQHVEQRLLKSEQQLAMLQQASVLHTSRSARQVVVQVIKVAAGAAQLDKRVSNTTFWKRLKDHRVPELASLLGLAEQDLRRVFDECITTRSLYAHLTPLHTLDKEVEDVVRMISPELEAVCSLECKVLAGYEKIKEIFYKEFV